MLWFWSLMHTSRRTDSMADLSHSPTLVGVLNGLRWIQMGWRWHNGRRQRDSVESWTAIEFLLSVSRYWVLGETCSFLINQRQKKKNSDNMQRFHSWIIESRVVSLTSVVLEKIPFTKRQLLLVHVLPRPQGHFDCRKGALAWYVGWSDVGEVVTGEHNTTLSYQCGLREINFSRNGENALQSSTPHNTDDKEDDTYCHDHSWDSNKWIIVLQLFHTNMEVICFLRWPAPHCGSHIKLCCPSW